MSTIQEFDFSVDILRSLLWRNNEAVNLQGLLQAKQDFFDSENEQFWNDWIVNVFDLRTANEFGLNVWSIILGLPITIEPVPEELLNQSFGFGALRKNFNNGNFSSATSEFPLTISEARLVLRLRYHQLTTNGNVSDINLILQDVFGDLGLAYVVDNLNMTIQYVFKFDLADAVLLVLGDLDVLPRPSGVGATTTTNLDNTNWGFGSFRRNFGNGNFTPL